MNEDSENTTKRVYRLKSSIYGIVALCIVLLFIVFAAFGVYDQFFRKPPKPSLPDLSRCTHLEVNFSKPLGDFLRYLAQFDPEFFNASEIEYFKSLNKVIINDKEAIKQISNALSSGKFKSGTSIGTVVYRHYRNPMYRAEYIISVIGYRQRKRIVSITNYDIDYIRTENGEIFVYDVDLPNLLFLSQQMQPFSMRWKCMYNLRKLHNNVNTSMDHSKWCDIILQPSTGNYGNSKEDLKCPSAGEGKCHYAMNPNCDPNSPGDMVLLFETRDGWNQHGGPELFTFDNHDPRGGCVLLNDGTVQFIRTEEELNNLRWK